MTYQLPSAQQSITQLQASGFKLFQAYLNRDTFLLGFAAMLLPAFAEEAAGPIALLLMLMSTLVSATMITHIDALARAEAISVRDAFTSSLRRVVPFVITLVLFTVICFVGYLLLVIPGILFSVSLLFAPYAALVQSKGPIEALSYSHSLVWGRWWRTGPWMWRWCS